MPLPVVKTATWRHRLLRIALKSLPAGARLHVEITFARGQPLYIVTAKSTVSTATSGARSMALLHLTQGSASSATVSVKL